MIRLVFPLLVLAVIVGAFLLLRASRADRRSAADEPREILRRRYQNAGRCSGLQAGGEGPRGSAR